MRIIASIVKFLQNGHSRKGVPAVPAKLRLHPSRVERGGVNSQRARAGRPEPLPVNIFFLLGNIG